MVQQQFVQDEVQLMNKTHLEPDDVRSRCRSCDSTNSEVSVSSVDSQASADFSTKCTKSKKKLAVRIFKKHEKKNILMTNTLLSYMSVDF